MPSFIHGLDHIALNVRNLRQSETFYTKILGGKMIWKNATNCFVRFGKKDVLALLAVPKGFRFPDLRRITGKKFSHFGFQAKSEKEVLQFAGHLRKRKIRIIEGPYRRSDGMSVYFLDPNGYTLEFFYISKGVKS